MKSTNEIISFIEGWIFAISTNNEKLDNGNKILRTLQDILSYAYGEDMNAKAHMCFEEKKEIPDIDYARSYSDEIYNSLVERFELFDDFKLGCKDVSGIVLNAILDTLDHKRYEQCDNLKAINEERKAKLKAISECCKMAECTDSCNKH